MSAATGSFNATGVGTAVNVTGSFNLTIYGTFSAVIVPERSFDAGTTWQAVTYSDGSVLQWQAGLSTMLSEPEVGVVWRLRCATFVSGQPFWRISQ